MSRHFVYPFHDYDSAREFMTGKTSRKIGNNTRLHCDPIAADVGCEAVVTVTLHGNKIAEIHPCDTVKVFDGGWRSATTKHRLSPFGIHQVKGEWFIGHGTRRKFENGAQVKFPRGTALKVYFK